jgi:transcription termination/antitermination protein NusG
MKYYAVQVASSYENKFIEQAEHELFDRRDQQRFIFPKRELKIWRHGKTLTEIQPLFSGYIFIETENIIDCELYRIIRQTECFYRFLKNNHDITPLQGHDLIILEHFIRLGETAGSSLVYFDQNDRIIVTEGPLKGLEGNIIKVDKRKQRAKIKLDFENAPMTFDLSFNIMRKEDSLHE